MKRCIICGNVDDDNSTVCSTCGNPYVDMGERVSDAETEQEIVSEEFESEGPDAAMPRQPEEAAESVSEQEVNKPEESASEQPEEDVLQQDVEEQPEETATVPQQDIPEQSETIVPSQPGADQIPTGNRPPHRMRSGPQIYGQTEGMNPGSDLYANQGTIRRTVPPRTAGQMQGNAGRPMDSAPAGSGRVPGGAARFAGQMPGGAGRPARQDFLSRRVMEAARKSLRSPLFFLIVLLNTVYVAASIAAVFLGELNYSQIARLLNEANLPQQLAGYTSMATTLLQKLDSGMIGVNIALNIPSILFCLGLWLIFIMALAAKDRMSGVGFGFAKASIIIRMIVACVLMLAVLVVTVTVVVAAWASRQTPIIIMAVVMLVVTIVVVMMVVMYYFAYLGALKTCRVNGDTGESYGKLSGYLAVLLILLALPGIVGLLSGIVNMEISNIVGSVAKMGWMILFAVWIFVYRGRMSELED